MISLDSVEQSILELEQKDTSFANCERLAWLYIVKDHLKGYSVEQNNPLQVAGTSEFLQIVNGKNTDKVWEIMGEVMESLEVLHPKMYQQIIDKIQDL